MAEEKQLSGPDFEQGVSLTELADGGMLQGHTKGEPILVARRGDGCFAIGAICTHYGAPLADGILVGDTVRCPWHHACFSLCTGEALRAPALAPVISWKIETRDGKLFVREKQPEKKRATSSAKTPENVIIVGGGAAGNAAAEMLRREGHSGDVTMISADDAIPYDRPTLSKDFLKWHCGRGIHSIAFHGLLPRARDRTVAEYRRRGNRSTGQEPPACRWQPS